MNKETSTTEINSRSAQLGQSLCYKKYFSCPCDKCQGSTKKITLPMSEKDFYKHFGFILQYGIDTEKNFLKVMAYAESVQKPSIL